MVKIIKYMNKNTGYEQYKVPIPVKFIHGLNMDITKKYEWKITSKGLLLSQVTP